MTDDIDAKEAARRLRLPAVWKFDLSPDDNLFTKSEAPFQAADLIEAQDILITELRQEVEGQEAEVPEDVCRLVVAAREACYGDQERETLDALDKALEAFASRVGWDDEPKEDTNG